MLKPRELYFKMQILIMQTVKGNLRKNISNHKKLYVEENMYEISKPLVQHFMQKTYFLF